MVRALALAGLKPWGVNDEARNDVGSAMRGVDVVEGCQHEGV